MAADPVLVRLTGVGRTFVSGELTVEVLKGLDLDIARGSFFVIVGPSGSGKTTLLNLIGGLDRCSKGKIEFDGRDLTACTAPQLTQYRRRSVGFVFQFYNLIPNLTARENVLVAAELVPEPLDVDETLRLVGLEHRKDHFPAQMSGGEQQRTSIARALAKNPELLLCDEPTGALDFETGKRVLTLLRDVQRRLGKTVIVITHNVAISQMADDVIRMRSGEIVERHRNPSPVSPEEITW